MLSPIFIIFSWQHVHGGGGASKVTFVVFDADGEVTFVVFDVDGEVTFVVFDVGSATTGGGGCDGSDGGGGGQGETRYHIFGGPSVDEVPPERAYDASHADAPRNI